MRAHRLLVLVAGLCLALLPDLAALAEESPAPAAGASDPVAWLFAVMVHLAPPERLAVLPAPAGWEETAEVRRARYASIASDLWATVEAAPPLYRGRDGRLRTAALVAAVAWMESGFSPDVDHGPCARGLGSRCDGGLSACLMQIRVGAGQTAEGWTRAELFADRRKCFAAGLRILRRSMAACGPGHELNAYAAGSCSKGEAAGHARLVVAARIWGVTGRPR